jgi:hypothetical protein
MSIIMENMAKKRARPRRSFTAEFKAEIVELRSPDPPTTNTVVASRSRAVASTPNSPSASPRCMRCRKAPTERRACMPIWPTRVFDTAVNASPGLCAPPGWPARAPAGGGPRPSRTRTPAGALTWSGGTSPWMQPRSTPAGAGTLPTSTPGRAGCIWPPSSTWPHAASSAGPVADHLRTDLVDAALTDALVRRRPASGLVFHSDRGSQGEFNRSSQHLDHGGVRCS